MTDENNRQVAGDIARLQTQVAYLTQQINDIQRTNLQQNEKLDKLLTQLSEARGGWRTLMWIGGSGTAFGIGLTWLIEYVPRLIK